MAHGVGVSSNHNAGELGLGLLSLIEPSHQLLESFSLFTHRQYDTKLPTLGNLSEQRIDFVARQLLDPVDADRRSRVTGV